MSNSLNNVVKYKSLNLSVNFLYTNNTLKLNYQI